MKDMSDFDHIPFKRPFRAVLHPSGWLEIHDATGRAIDTSGDGGFSTLAAADLLQYLNETYEETDKDV